MGLKIKERKQKSQEVGKKKVNKKEKGKILDEFVEILLLNKCDCA